MKVSHSGGSLRFGLTEVEYTTLGSKRVDVNVFDRPKQWATITPNEDGLIKIQPRNDSSHPYSVEISSKHFPFHIPPFGIEDVRCTVVNRVLIADRPRMKNEVRTRKVNRKPKAAPEFAGMDEIRNAVQTLNKARRDYKGQLKLDIIDGGFVRATLFWEC